MEKPKKEKEKKPKASAHSRPASSRKHLKADILQLATAVKSAANFPTRNNWQSNPRQKRVCHLLGTRYAMVATKNRWEEQGFFLDDSQVNYGLEPVIYNRLNDLGWFRLARQPARANLNWVIEFYTSNSAGEDNVTVRGRRVAANAVTVNEILGLPNDKPRFYTLMEGLEDEDYDTIRDFLYEEGTAWNTTGRNPHSVSRPSLRPEARLWNTFVKRNIIPTSHNQTVDRTRLLLIHTIMTGYQINIGEIIAQEIAEACQNDKGILAFLCIISALCQRATVPTSPADKCTAEKTCWTRAIYMRKMDIADATPINVVMPTPPTSPTPMPTAAANEEGPSVRAEASSAPAEPRPAPAATPLVVPVSSHTTTVSPATTPTARPRSRESTPDTPLGSTPISPPSPPVSAQSEEAAPPLHILQLRSQLQRIEARQLQFQEETKVFNQSLVKFLCFQFPSVAAFFAQPTSAPPQPNLSAAAQPSANTSAKPIDPTPSKLAMAVPILSVAPTPATSAIAERPTPDSLARRKGKATAGSRTDPTARIGSVGRSISSVDSGMAAPSNDPHCMPEKVTNFSTATVHAASPPCIVTNFF
ncbi:hypothetical protein V6N12_014088 [Hibiscus sabdariffa]|uniref:Putative plant transposon protein domain-containing protein n=1 Tax=Hibiscus sabdariffa TaxID=183260 RepID=A0ABR2CXX0_9ROSI